VVAVSFGRNCSRDIAKGSAATASTQMLDGVGFAG
jgi:hypothetical protein